MRIIVITRILIITMIIFVMTLTQTPKKNGIKIGKMLVKN